MGVLRVGEYSGSHQKLIFVKRKMAEMIMPLEELLFRFPEVHVCLADSPKSTVQRLNSLFQPFLEIGSQNREVGAGINLGFNPSSAGPPMPESPRLLACAKIVSPW